MEAKVSVVIPAYNEEESIADVVLCTKRVEPGFEIIVVDDGSSDSTAQRAVDAGAKVISHPYNIGNGSAVKTGVRNTTGDIIVLMDGDGQHQPEDIPRLLADLDGFDMVVGARTSDAPVSRFRRFGNWGLIRLANYLTGFSIPDLTSGFRAIKRERMAEVLHLLPNTYSYPTTLTMALLKSGYPVKWVMLDTIRKREKGESKVQPFHDGLRFINIMLRVIMLFDPQKIFLPVSGLLSLLGGLLLLYDIVRFNGIQESAMLLIIAGIFTFFFGLLADQMASIRRDLKQFASLAEFSADKSFREREIRE